MSEPDNSESDSGARPTGEVDHPKTCETDDCHRQAIYIIRGAHPPDTDERVVCEPCYNMFQWCAGVPYSDVSSEQIRPKTATDGGTTPRDDLGFELWGYEIGAVDVILFDWAEGADLFTTAGTATTAREAAEHSGPTIKDGQYRDFVIEENRSGLVGGYHPHAGRRETHAPSVEFDQPVTLLTELNHVE